MRNIKYILFLIILIACSATMYQAIRHDDTLTGDGTTASPLGVNRGSTITTDNIVADKDDYAPTGWDDASVVRIDMGGMYKITGFAAPSASTKPQEKLLMNVDSFTVVLTPQHPSSTAANRFADRNGSFYLAPGESCTIHYDDTSERWRISGEETIEGKTGLFYSWFPGSIAGGDQGSVAFLAIGSGTNTATASTTTLPACSQFNTGTGASTWGFMQYFTDGSITYSAFASAHQYAEAIISIPTLSDAGETFTVELQITNTPSTTSLETNNTIGIRYSHGIAGGDWELFSQDNAGAEGTPDDLDVAVATATLYKLRIEIDKPKTEARAYINDVYVGRITSNLPNSVVCGARVVLLKSNGTGARTLNVHSLSAGAIYK